jgi:hypothetical protein
MANAPSPVSPEIAPQTATKENPLEDSQRILSKPTQANPTPSKASVFFEHLGDFFDPCRGPLVGRILGGLGTGIGAIFCGVATLVFLPTVVIGFLMGQSDSDICHKIGFFLASPAICLLFCLFTTAISIGIMTK